MLWGVVVMCVIVGVLRSRADSTDSSMYVLVCICKYTVSRSLSLSLAFSLSHTHTHTHTHTHIALPSVVTWSSRRHDAPLMLSTGMHEVRLKVWCSVLQCAAVCCSVLQCVAVCRIVLQCVAALRRVEY